MLYQSGIITLNKLLHGVYIYGNYRHSKGSEEIAVASSVVTYITIV